jgi:hypothetical protein
MEEDFHSHVILERKNQDTDQMTIVTDIGLKIEKNILYLYLPIEDELEEDETDEEDIILTLFSVIL